MRLLLPCLLSFMLFLSAAYAEDTVPATKAADVAAIKDFPPRSDSGLTKAEGQIAEGKYVQALETLGGVLKRRPADADALSYIGYAWYRLGETQKATQYINQALQIDPQHLGANKLKADMFLDAGDQSRALEQLQVIRMVCGGLDCAELDTLQSELNKSRKGEYQKKEPAAAPKADVNAPANGDK